MAILLIQALAALIFTLYSSSSSLAHLAVLDELQLGLNLSELSGNIANANRCILNYFLPTECIPT
jgi:hypothetical protein